MRATQQQYVRDETKHEYNIVPIIDGVHMWPKRIIGSFVRITTGERKSLERAMQMMEARDDVQAVHIYHTHPFHGPMDRYIGLVMRGDNFIRYVR